MTLLELAVSIGEAIDKLTILDIKCNKISDKRKDDVEKEYNILYEKLKDIVEEYKLYYNIMKQINLDIWDMMDILRDCQEISDEDYYKKCRECIESNDVRFRIKNKINSVSKSLLKEQKGYKVQRFIFDLKNINQKIDNRLIVIIKYYSFLYDEILIISNEENKSELENIFNYDPTVIIESNYEKNLSNNIIEINDSEKINDIEEKLKITDDIKKKYFSYIA